MQGLEYGTELRYGTVEFWKKYGTELRTVFSGKLRYGTKIRYYFFRTVIFPYISFKGKKFGFDFAEIIALNILYELPYQFL